MSQSVQWNLTAVLEHCGPLVGECVPPGSVTEEFLRSFMKTSASPQFIAALALIGPPRGELLVRNLLQIPFGEQGSLSQAQINEREGWKLSVLALRALYNILSSQRIMDSVRSLPLDNWRKLLRMIPISLEVTACLSRIAEVLYRNFSLHVDYPMIHEDFAVLYTDLPESVDRSFMTAFFLWFLREDVGYLAECKSTVDPNAFVSLLKVVDTVLDSPSHGKTLKIHYNNVRFVELYVEELASNIFDNLDSDFVLKVLCPAVSIIANALIYNPFSEGSYYDTDEMNTLKTLCDMFEAIYDIDAQEILSEQDDLNEAENDRGDGQPLRPAPSKPYRRPFLSQSVKDLAFLLKRASAAELAELRTSILKALGALASKKEKYAEEMADRRLVPLVISCARITVHSPFQMQHAITTLSMMCKHRRNQELLFEVEQTPTGAIDHEKLLAELGMRAVVDATGKLKLEKL
ncbi:hypothetical protein QR680_009292 [Steinernema hermaphroditum]|uniref:Ataxin-10 domain-containing protein n=1 Tax=Steinernema hermaphroditum TaxID=289476 RepID=A0AA39IJR2_9BILA|nr:hypothetical protein QR680_009292 [Steinernema hermaphroditum]